MFHFSTALNSWYTNFLLFTVKSNLAKNEAAFRIYYDVTYEKEIEIQKPWASNSSPLS